MHLNIWHFGVCRLLYILSSVRTPKKIRCVQRQERGRRKNSNLILAGDVCHWKDGVLFVSEENSIELRVAYLLVIFGYPNSNSQFTQ